MACNTINETIDGIKYTVTQFGARQGASLIVRLSKLIGPALDDLGNGNVNIALLLEKLDDTNVTRLILELLSLTKRNGTSIDDLSFDSEFAGEFEHLLKVLWLVIKTNNFLGKGNIGLKIQEIMKNMISPTSTELPIN